jgi:hypothetical protein
MKKLAILFLPALMLTLTSCEEDYRSVSAPLPAPMMAAPKAYDSGGMRSESEGAAPEVQKRVARTHNISISTDGDDLGKRYQADVQKCEALGCELANSNISENYASLNVRINPAKLDEFITFLGRDGAKISSHSVNSEDKTIEYIDTDARIRNSEALKERLVKLLSGTESKDIKAILEIEKELARVQQEIDSAKSTLKYLSTITSMTTLYIEYQAEFESGAINYKELKNSFRYAWQGFIMNVAYVIQFIGQSLPWIPVIILGIWILKRTIRYRRRNKEG